MTKTKLLGEWSGKNASKQASGIASHHACETTRGFLERATRHRLRVFCGECQALRRIAECTRIRDEKENSSTYDVILEICRHQRSVTVAVEFTPSQKEKRGWTQTEAIESHPVESVDPEIREIRSAMESEQLL